ncbi:MAG: hypothetical protein ACFFCI_19440 [Promethearchaeota archaeon]
MARDYFKEAWDDFEEPFYYWYNKGRELYRQGNYREAIRHFICINNPNDAISRIKELYDQKKEKLGSTPPIEVTISDGVSIKYDLVYSPKTCENYVGHGGCVIGHSSCDVSYSSDCDKYILSKSKKDSYPLLKKPK